MRKVICNKCKGKGFYFVQRKKHSKDYFCPTCNRNVTKYHKSSTYHDIVKKESSP